MSNVGSWVEAERVFDKETIVEVGIFPIVPSRVVFVDRWVLKEALQCSNTQIIVWEWKYTQEDKGVKVEGRARVEDMPEEELAEGE